MIDSVEFNESNNDVSRKLLPEVTSEQEYIFTSMGSYTKNDIIVENINTNNEKLLMKYGRVMFDNSKDCFGIGMSFTSNKEDQLSEKRASFFSKYFLFDENHNDYM